MSSKSKLGCAIDAAAFGAQLWSRLRARSILPPLHAGVGGQLRSGLLVSGQKKKYVLFALVSAGVRVGAAPPHRWWTAFQGNRRNAACAHSAHGRRPRRFSCALGALCQAAGREQSETVRSRRRVA